ncbi:MAG: alpha-glucan family phosphorylase [Nitrospira sp.]|nr:alpha-glucan family phosphorylase [Nitrospira sp.]HRC44884.1 alpha-glucan family phosphorylase [Nitrospira sp.]
MSTIKDPVCGMMVPVGEGLSVVYQGQEFRFCSDLCKRTFLATPERYATGSTGLAPGTLGVTRRIAYFSMEVAADPGMPTYSGGLGVLADDTLRSCADLKIPIVGVSLLYRRGYFEQHLDEWGNQHERPVQWDPSRLARLLPTTVRMSIEGRPVVVRAWQHDITGLTGYVVPLLLLDTNVEENAAVDRELTSDLYGGDERYRLAQEIVLGIGGVRMLRALGYTQVERLHMNEGHAALLAIELLRERKERESPAWDFDEVRRACIFTTHTPVPAGHDQFSYELVKQMLGDAAPLEVLQMLGGRDRLNMTLLALNMSTYVNGVAKRHGEVSQEMFPGYAIDSITNGIHSATWTSPSFQQLFDRHIPGWRADSFALRHAISIPVQDIWAAHAQAKARLFEEVRKRTSLSFRDDALTIGFARRATQYKRAELVFSEPSQLLDMAGTVGPIQFIFAGKAHPKDEPGKEIIRRIIHIAGQLNPEIPIAYLENYDLLLAKLLTSGVDLWLNTPLRPLEASGTSGMKAAHNGVPSLSVLDGWWVEGCIEGVTGWAIGRGSSDAASQEGSGARDARELYDKLRGVIAPLFYQDRERWSGIMRSTIAFNASFFNTHRMVQQYTANAYV